MRWFQLASGGLLTAVLFVLLSPGTAVPQPFGKGKGKDAEHGKDMEIFHYLLEQRAHITRTIKKTEKGVETLTESDKPEVAAKIQEHAEAMHKRIKDVRPIHMRDPLFAAIFQNAKKITMTVEKTKKGVKVIELSDDPHVAKMIQTHAEVVSGFIKNGHAEMRTNHPVPDAPRPKR